MLSTDNKIHDGFLEIEIEQFLFYTKKKKKDQKDSSVLMMIEVKMTWTETS